MSAERGEEARLVADTIRALQKHLQCVICFETLRDPMTTRCGHTFCQICINRVLKGKNALCPLCNIRMNRRGIVENEKIRSVVQAVHIIISNAQKDIADMGYEDVIKMLYFVPALQLLKESTLTSPPNCLSPIEPASVTEPNRIELPSTSMRKSKRVESWLLDVHPTTSSQVSVPSVQPVVSTNEDTDSEMESVSQINPDQTSKKKPLSECIEDDCEPKQIVKKPVLQKSKKLTMSKKGGQINVKSKQESLKGFGTLKVTPTKTSGKSVKGNIEINVPDPVIVLMDLDKENSDNQLPTRSPGWSRFKKMKKDFQGSPAPSIEDPASSDETPPCLNLSLDSPVLKKKDRYIEIVNSLQSEIEICERSIVPITSNIEKPALQSKNLKKRFSEPAFSGVFKQPVATMLPSSSGFSGPQPIVKFLKLGPLSRRKSPSVPIYLKGPLEHVRVLQCRTQEHVCCVDTPSKPFRLSLDAGTQTDSDLIGSPQGAESPIRVFSSPGARRSAGAQSVVDMDAETVLFTQPGARRSAGAQSEVDMDAETVLFTQPLVPTITSNIRTASPPSLPHETSVTSETEIIECTYPHNSIPYQEIDAFNSSQDAPLEPEKISNTLQERKKESQDSELICSSLDIVGTPKKTFDEETTSNNIPHVILDEDSCSSLVHERSSKRPRTLDSFSDSSDSDVGVSKKQQHKRRNKTQVLSDNENSSSFPIDDPDTSIVDTSKIMANIEAQIAAEERMQSSVWLDQEAEKNTEPVSEAFEDCLDVLSNTSRNQIDSDGDSEVINPTPQKQTSFISRQTTQSSDIVPSSQPMAPILPTHKPPSENNKKEAAGTKSLDAFDLLIQHSNVLEPESEPPKNTNQAVPEQENPSSSQEPTTGKALEEISSSDAQEAAALQSTIKPPKLQFVCSSLPGSLVAQVEKLAKLVGAEFSSKFMADTSHLVVRVGESNKADKTLKYLCAVAAGKWVVSYAWVEKCLETRKLLPEEPFEALDASGEPGPRRSREARLSNKSLFDGFEFCCIGDFPDISKAQMQALLIDCGASVISMPEEFSYQDGIIPVALAQWDESHEDEYSSWLSNYSTPLVQHEWVLDCIGKFAVTSFSAMLLCDVTEDYLASMKIPSYLFELTESEQ